MTAPINVDVSPYTEGTQTKWNLTVNGKKGGYGNYPDVKVSKGDKDVDMVYTIKDGGTWKFAKDSAALWASDDGTDPTGPSVSVQIPQDKIKTSNNDTVLKFKDLNNDPGPVHYTLNFVNGTQTSSTLDPIIDNGGPGMMSSYSLPVFFGGLVVGAILTLLLRPVFQSMFSRNRPNQ
jgi:hypothetical protein